MNGERVSDVKDAGFREPDRLLDVLLSVYKPEGAGAWLIGRNQLLDDERPVDLLERGEVDRVRAAIEAMADGVFV